MRRKPQGVRTNISTHGQMHCKLKCSPGRAVPVIEVVILIWTRRWLVIVKVIYDFEPRLLLK